MAKKRKTDRTSTAKSATAEGKTGSLGFENRLWEAADLLRNNMDPAEYKHVVLGLLLPKLISGEIRVPEAEHALKEVL